MKIYEQGVEVADLPLIKWSGGIKYLYTIHLYNRQFTPYYRGVLLMWRSPGIVHIKLFDRMINLQARRPWIWLEPNNLMEDE